VVLDSKAGDTKSQRWDHVSQEGKMVNANVDWMERGGGDGRLSLLYHISLGQELRKNAFCYWGDVAPESSRRGQKTWERGKKTMGGGEGRR